MSFSRSSSATSNTETNQNQQVEAGQSGIAVGAGANFTQVDEGAVKAGTDVANSALAANQAVTTKGLETAVQFAQQNADLATTAIEKGGQNLDTFAQSLSDQAAARASADAAARRDELSLASDLTGEVVRANQPADVTGQDTTITLAKYGLAAAAIVAVALLFVARKSA